MVRKLLCISIQYEPQQECCSFLEVRTLFSNRNLDISVSIGIIFSYEEERCVCQIVESYSIRNCTYHTG